MGLKRWLKDRLKRWLKDRQERNRRQNWIEVPRSRPHHPEVGWDSLTIADLQRLDEKNRQTIANGDRQVIRFQEEGEDG